jgi:protein required for attachment to host cells
MTDERCGRRSLKSLQGLKNIGRRGRHWSPPNAGETTGLTMVASPRALGMIRSDYSPAVRKALHGELHKDLVRRPVHEIEKQLLA